MRAETSDTLSTRFQAPVRRRLGRGPRRPSRARALVAATVLALALPLLPVGVATAGLSTPPVPSTPSVGRAIEGYAAYEPGTTCDPVDRPGAKKVARLIRETYGQDQSIGISRNACYTISEHNEGRAVDWMLDASNRADMATARAFFRWLFAPDKYGNPDAMARRLGVMYIIWNHRMWRAYEGGVWGDYSGTDPHTDHIHISLSLDGATGRTSFWTGQPLAGPCEASGYSSPTPRLPADPMSFVPVPAARVLTTSTGRGTDNGPCRLFAPLEYQTVPTRLDALVTGVGGVPSTGVAAVALQVTMRRPSVDSNLRAGPAGQALPGAARVSAAMNGTSTSLLVVPVGADGKVTFETSGGATDVVVDVVGYYRAAAVATAPRSAGAGDLYSPVRVWRALSTDQVVAAGGKRKLAVAGLSGVPAAASAVVVNVNVAASAGRGELYAYPSGGARPRGELVSYRGGHLTTIQTVVPVGADGSITVENVGRHDKAVSVDVLGAFVSPSSRKGLGFVARKRVVTVASSAKNVGLTTLDSGDTKVLALGRHLPPEARSAVLTVSIRRPDADTRLTLWRGDGTRPVTVDVSASAGQTMSSTVVVPLSPTARIKLRSVGANNVDVRINLVGYLQ
jgi:hypothetical protein